MSEIVVEDNYGGKQCGGNTQGDEIARGKLHLLHARSALAARIAAALHGKRKLVGSAEG